MCTLGRVFGQLDMSKQVNQGRQQKIPQCCPSSEVKKKEENLNVKSERKNNLKPTQQFNIPKAKFLGAGLENPSGE